MISTKFLILTLTILSIKTQETVDLRRKRTFRRHRVLASDKKSNTNKIDLSSQTVTPIFESLNTEYLLTAPAPKYRNFLYTTTAEVNNEMLITYRIDRNHKFVIIIRTTNHNSTNPDEEIHRQRLVFNCKTLDVVDEFLCMPKKCDLSNFEPIKTPAVECEDHYKESQVLIEYTMDSVKNVSQTEDFIECVREHFEVVVPNPKSMCYFVGFRPDNIVPLEDLEQKLLDEGYEKIGDEYVKKSLLETNIAQVKVDELAFNLA